MTADTPAGEGEAPDGRQERNLVLVGFMGTGKSAVGHRLARRLGRPFFDTDRWIREQANMTIPEIFSLLGETTFRDLETEACREVAGRGGRVVATGGGILAREENRRLLRRRGVLVCLRAAPEQILRRTAPWESRPILRRAADPLAEIRRLLAEREPLYREADLQVDTTDLDLDKVVQSICDALKLNFPGDPTRS